MFKELDIRGKYPTEINERKMRILGEAISRSAPEIIAGMDYRKNNSVLLRAFAEGYGKEMIFLGNVPTPALAFSAMGFGIMFTASHNPPEYAGMKFFRNRTYISKEEMGKIKKEFEGIEKKGGRKSGSPTKLNTIESIPLVNHYLDSIPEIQGGVFDLCGGAACALKEIFPKRIFDAPDPEYKKHSAEPKDDTLNGLKKKTIKRNLVGFAFDGDGDRLQVVDKGKLIEGDVAAAFVANRHMKGGDRIVLSIDCRQEVFDFIEDLGLKAITSKVGDAYVVEKALQTGAIFSAERSGHFTFYSHAPNSDGIYAAAVLSGNKAGEFFEFGSQFRNVTCKDEVFYEADFGKLKGLLEEKAERVETTDGVRAKFENFTLLIRQSTTEPKIRINSEAKTEERAKEGMRLAKKALLNCKDVKNNKKNTR